MYIYLELPEDKVPSELIDGTAVVTGIVVTVKATHGSANHDVVVPLPKPARGLRSRLYVTNRSLEEIHAGMMKMGEEILALQSSWKAFT
jgi:hypothetical protein